MTARPMLSIRLPSPENASAIAPGTRLIQSTTLPMPAWICRQWPIT